MFKPLISFQDSNFDLTRTKLNLDVHCIPPSSKVQLVVPVILLWQGWYMYLWHDGTVLYTLVYMCIQRCMEIYLNLVRYNRNSLVFTYKDKTQFTQFVKWNFYHDISYTFIDHHVFMNSISVIKPLSIQHCTFILPVC